ncbi:MAG: hypothetical protein ACQERX_06245 [Bacillota bacterium]
MRFNVAKLIINLKSNIMNSEEKELQEKLTELKNKKKYIALSLYPPKMINIISKEGNTAKINEGRAGKFDNISEAFYDLMVDKFDSREQNR